AEINGLLSLPTPPEKPIAPEPPGGFLSRLRIGNEFRKYEQARASHEAALKQYEAEHSIWLQHVFGIRERAVAESIWRDFHRRVPAAAVEQMSGTEFEVFLCSSGDTQNRPMRDS
ncbi:MAG: hypothetical protein JSR72_01700, partial [Proteobacteria bacterium]|nr:hypothetical protein [Pseudomonadota bacterium]